MDSIVSSPSHSSDSIFNHKNSIQYEQLSNSNDEYSYEKMPVITNVKSIDLSKSKQSSTIKRTATVIYGPICIKKRMTVAPTLATGRRSKDAIVEGEAALKREIRRMKNRELARNLKKTRDNIEIELKNTVNELEIKEHELLTQINTLHVYKQYLEEQCQYVNRLNKLINQKTSPTLIEIEQNEQKISKGQHGYYDITDLKEEPSSPEQWQLVFHI